MVPPVVRMVTRGFVGLCADSVQVSASTPSAAHRTRRAFGHGGHSDTLGEKSGFVSRRMSRTASRLTGER